MTITIRKEFAPGGVPTDPTGESMRLSDNTETFGVKRLDTDAIIVANDTEMTRLGVGIYALSFEEPADSLTYEYWVEYEYAGATVQTEHSIVGGVSQSDNLYDLIPRVRTVMTGIINPVELQQKIRMVATDFFRKTEIWTQDLDAITSVADQEDYSLTTSFSAFIHRVRRVVITDANDNEIQWSFMDVATDGGTVTLVPAYTTSGDDIDVEVILIPQEDCTQYPAYLMERWGAAIVDGTIAYYAGREFSKSYDPVRFRTHNDRYEDAIAFAKGENITRRGPGIVMAVKRRFV